MTAPEVDDGPWRAVPWGRRFTVEDVLDPYRDQPRYDTREQAQAEADQRNQQYLARRRPRPPQPVQPDLFNSQEAI